MICEEETVGSMVSVFWWVFFSHNRKTFWYPVIKLKAGTGFYFYIMCAATYFTEYKASSLHLNISVLSWISAHADWIESGFDQTPSLSVFSIKVLWPCLADPKALLIVCVVLFVGLEYLRSISLPVPVVVEDTSSSSEYGSVSPDNELSANPFLFKPSSKCYSEREVKGHRSLFLR